MAPLWSTAQLIIDNCNPLIKSLHDVVYVVRQDFALEDENGELFGQNGNNFFGYAIGPAVVVNGTLVYSRHTLKPFLSDTTYKEYGIGYQPVSTNTYAKRLEANELAKMEGEREESVTYASIPLPDTATIKDDAQIAVKDSMDCVVVTYLAKNKSNLEKSHYRLSYLHNTVKWQGNEGALKNELLGADAVFGLLFYENIGHGEVGYVLGGFVEKINDEWVVTRYQQLKPLTKSTKDEQGKKKRKK